MNNTSYQARRYKVEAKRDPADSEWTDWTMVDDYEEAVRQLDIIRSLSFCGRIVDKSGITDIVKMIEAEYEKALKLDYVKKPLAFALYAVWKQVDKEDKER